MKSELSGRKLTLIVNYINLLFQYVAKNNEEPLFLNTRTKGTERSKQKWRAFKIHVPIEARPSAL